MKTTLLTAITAAAIIAGAAVADDVSAGRETYERFCATCHGLEATGHGPMRPVLLVPPADLTTLIERNGGTFPLARVVKRIDGRDPLVSHGSPMPVYGDFFETGEAAALKTESGQPVLTSAKVAELVAFLKSLQNPAN